MSNKTVRRKLNFIECLTLIFVFLCCALILRSCIQSSSNSSKEEFASFYEEESSSVEVDEVADSKPIVNKKTLPKIIKPKPVIKKSASAGGIKAQQRPPKKVEPKSIKKPINYGLHKTPKKWTQGLVMKTGEVLIHSDVIIGKLNPSLAKNKKPVRVNYPDEWGRLWPSNKIPIKVSKELENHKGLKLALEYFENNTPISWTELKSRGEDGLHFKKSEYCASYVGKIGGNQPVFLSDKCGQKEACHEILHALYAIHEHSRPDRDSYIQINWENIEDDKLYNFEIFPEESVHLYTGSAFGYHEGSVMMYPPKAFSKNSKPTLEGTKREIRPFVSKCLGEIDIERLGYLYGE